MTVQEATVAAFLLGSMHAGQQTTVALAATVAAVTGDNTRVTADEGDGHEREEHRESKTEKPLHHRPPVEERNAPRVREAVTN